MEVSKSIEKKSLTLQIPGSTSNLGPGFDTLSLALCIYTHMRFEILPHNDISIPFVTLKGAVAKRSESNDQGRLIYSLLSKLWQDDRELLQRLRIVLHSDIPLGCGVGGTATAVLGCLWASYALKDIVPTRRLLLAEGTALEGHPENLAASLLGKMVVCSRSADGASYVTQQHNWPEKWVTIIVIPSYTLTTAQARAILPKKIPFEDAVLNIQRTALLVSAVANCDEGAMKEALHDRLHEQYRDRLVPELGQLRRHLADQPIIGCVLSGGGSSVLIIVNQAHKDEVLGSLNQWNESHGGQSTIFDLKVDNEGICEVP